MVMIVLCKLVRRMISRRCFSPSSLAQNGANIMDDFESMFFTNGSSSGKAQQKAHYNNQGVMHNFDLNEIPPFNDNEQSLIEELHDKAQDKGQDVMHYANIMDDFESMFFTNGSSSRKAQQKTHYNNQGVMHNFDLNEIPPFNDNEQSLIEELHEKAQDKDVMHFANMDIDASPILRNDEQPTNSSISVKQSSSSAQIFHKKPHESVSESMIVEEPLFFINALYGASSPCNAPFIPSNLFLPSGPSTAGNILNHSFDALGPFHSPYASPRVLLDMEGIIAEI